MMDKLRDKMNAWLNSGRGDDLIERTISEEMCNAIDEVIPEIRELCRSAVRKAVDELKAEDIVFDKDKLARNLNDSLNDSLVTYSDEIEETLYDQLVAELKEVKILGVG
jgi:hypothetical protein